ncbi:3-oxoacyl-[acyl-carrier-protein] synthase, KASI (EC 2.3.1.41) [uncultured Gammaproteobacteria bacterium]|jgi:3-oxoacyl-[acyl-carrier-protein] synthase-1|nr:3-oxoacyl-[acyl-carrier-protein] synthase, KASI (EC 2.3.1.41) [uncultured Gammaproteobacteria bacterium]CAC9595523.1 3-oxoacyl-[acyl-carrier-protein] synthase, KASI (EC 2.3.1.41) [uncultured Gammaproteobacteria bacterium]CAC9598787.1 3-oxoacyl-[acyl-carrier-protein] synthase, KASI (EC 2.3.1.41) [uncultured Gammaproteobacteria bacterium]CAC9608397.1 3-oxoacyl-[acyl-carrier-protein] synthase, KASI (EC 2.3.1.41) [uncultured Gammaproteobacteria bacterium]CAC9620564.1 3-oxoacyl-[acyl-carrier-prot
MLERVAITGMGIVSSIGNDINAVLSSLKNCTSGITPSEELKELNLRSQVIGNIDIDVNQYLTKKQRRFLSPVASLCAITMQQAVETSGLNEAEISNQNTGLIVGSGSASNDNVISAYETLRNKGAKKIDPFRILKTMSSTASANLASLFKIKGLSYSISAACATSSHCIGNAFEQIQQGKQNIMFAGGGDEVHWSSAVLFDAMRALSATDNPVNASIPFAKNRDGFVISGGAGIIVLENLEHARQRGANILAELVAYGTSSDGCDIVKPNTDGAILAMQKATHQAKDLGVDIIDYINAHATSTKVGDSSEIQAIQSVFGDSIPPIGATKSLTGHPIGASGVHELIYSILMMQNNFVFGNHNYELDDKFKNMPILRHNQDIPISTVMSNSFGFGGTNASLIIKKYG